MPQRPRGAALSVFSEKNEDVKRLPAEKKRKKDTPKRTKEKQTPCGLAPNRLLLQETLRARRGQRPSACLRLRACWRKRRVAEARKKLASLSKCGLCHCLAIACHCQGVGQRCPRKRTGALCLRARLASKRGRQACDAPPVAAEVLGGGLRIAICLPRQLFFCAQAKLPCATRPPLRPFAGILGPTFYCDSWGATRVESAKKPES